jgi:hypothetical protein
MSKVEKKSKAAAKIKPPPKKNTMLDINVNTKIGALRALGWAQKDSDIWAYECRSGSRVETVTVNIKHSYMTKRDFVNKLNELMAAAKEKANMVQPLLKPKDKQKQR